MHVAYDPFLFGVVHGLMARVSVFNADVRAKLIRVDGLGFVLDVALDEVMEGIALDIRYALYANLSPALDSSRNPLLVALVAVALALRLAASVSSTSTTPRSVGPEKGSFPIASRILWQRYHAVR